MDEWRDKETGREGKHDKGSMVKCTTDAARIGGSPDVAFGLKLLNHHVSSHNFIKAQTQSTFSKATHRMLVVINKVKEREGWKIPPTGNSTTKSIQQKKMSKIEIP